MSRPRTSVSIQLFPSTYNMKLDISVARPWKVKPGQYVYLTMPRPGLTSTFQRHPFMIAASSSHQHDFEIRIQPGNGFTRQLLLGNYRNTDRLRAFIEGPYGHALDLQEFGTIVLFASGIGIVSHLPYIQQLVEDYREFRTKTRDLLLVWNVDNEAQVNLVAEDMTALLRKDDLPLDYMVQNGPPPKVSSKAWRRSGDSITPERPGERPAPYGENASKISIS